MVLACDGQMDVHRQMRQSRGTNVKDNDKVPVDLVRLKAVLPCGQRRNARLVVVEIHQGSHAVGIVEPPE